MPAIVIHPPDSGRGASATAQVALPELLQTPSGLAVVEIQGTLNTPDGDSVAFPVGKLVFPHYNPDAPKGDQSWQKRVHLYVGKHQRLTGEVKKLAKPLAVMRKREGTTDEGELEIAEIIYYKLLFAHRPEPVGGSGN
jgi:chromosome transmission fidelity protein 8